MPPNPSHDGTTEGWPARAGQCDERSDSNQEDDELVFVNTGRYIKRCVHPFASISNILVIAQENLNPGSNPEGIRLNEEGIRRYTGYCAKVMAFCPGLQTLLEQYGKVPRKVSKDLQLGMRTARSNDAHTLKGLAGRLASTSQTPFNLSIDSKSDRGFNHNDLGRMLIPIDYLEAYNLDPADVVEKINDVNNEYNVTADLLPAFLYEDPDYYNPDNLLEGLMRGYFLVRARFSISSQQTWSCKEGPFDYDTFAETIFGLFEVDWDWTRETISWWNLHVFGHRNGLTSMGSALRNTANGALARAKAQAAQRRIEEAAAYNEEPPSSPLTPPSDEEPRNEEASSSFNHQNTPTTQRPEEIGGNGGRLDEDSEGEVPARQSRKRSSRAHPEDQGAGNENDSEHQENIPNS
ncbi:hypothetical protein EDB86DRAFT_3093844 [Lactarius hatsudake]|nr:hypothetical protein EDB86DRAFT_3093844 [Lactarius hatsudake]